MKFIKGMKDNIKRELSLKSEKYFWLCYIIGLLATSIIAYFKFESISEALFVDLICSIPVFCGTTILFVCSRSCYKTAKEINADSDIEKGKTKLIENAKNIQSRNSYSIINENTPLLLEEEKILENQYKGSSIPQKTENRWENKIHKSGSKEIII
ncbi:MAG: hypothetical protein ACK4OM_05660 [Alphaproteobacteria bacterium]